MTHPDDFPDDAITRAMLVYGGSFVRALGALWPLADDDNRARLKAAFPEYFQHYAELARLKAAKEAQRTTP